MRWMSSRILIAGLVVSLGGITSAKALMIAPPSPTRKVAEADAIVVGRIVAMEDKDIETSPFPGSPNKIPFRIAVLQVNETLQGSKDVKTIRLGFQAPAEVKQVQPGQPLRPNLPIRSGSGGTSFQAGNEGLFYLRKHHTEGFLVPTGYYGFVPSQSPTYEKEVGGARKLAQLASDPMAALNSKDAQEKLTGASFLISKYRRGVGGQITEVPIDAKVSKQILATLAEADWKAEPMVRGQNELHPYMLFSQLGVGPKDGFQQPKNVRQIQDVYDVAKRWLQENQNKYVIKRIEAVKK